MAKKPETASRETAGGGNPILELAEAEYKSPPAEKIAEILALEGDPGEALAEMGSLLAHYEGPFQPAEMERLLAVVETAGEDDDSSYIRRHYLTAIANMLIYRHGGQLELPQVERLLEAMSANKLGGWAIESLITLHRKQLPLEEVDFMLKRWGINSLRLAAVERYGEQLAPERVRALIDELAKEKERAGESLDREIKSRGPYTDISRLPMIRERDDLPEGLRNKFLDERCPEIHAALSSIAKNCAGRLEAEDMDRLGEIGNVEVKAHLLAHCRQQISPERTEALRSSAEPLAFFKVLIDHDLPLPEWKNELAERIIEGLDKKDWRTAELLAGEPYVGHLSETAAEKLAESKAFGTLLFEEVNYLPESLPVSIESVLRTHGRRMGYKWFDEFGGKLPPESMPLLVESVTPSMLFYIIENYPERLPGRPDAAERARLVMEKCFGCFGKSWLEENNEYVTTADISRLLEYLPRTGGYYRWQMAEAVSRLCPEKVMPEKVPAILEYGRGDAGRELRPLLVETYWRYLLEHFEDRVLDSQLKDEFLRQHSEKLSPEQIENWRRQADIYSMRDLLTYCGPRLKPEQVRQCLEYIRAEGPEESLYRRVMHDERRPGLLQLIIETAGQNMPDDCVESFLEDDGWGSKWPELFLRHHPERFSPGQKLAIARRFGWKHHRVGLGSF